MTQPVDLAAKKINVETLNSDAILALADSKAVLEKRRQDFTDKCRTSAEAMTRAEIVKGLEDLDPKGLNPGKSADPKAVLVDLLVQAHVKRHETAIELRKLTEAADADRKMARSLNAAIDGVIRAHALATSSRDDDLFGVAHSLSWNGDNFMVASFEARTAIRIADLIREGKDIREISLYIAQQAIRTVIQLPRYIMNNGTGSINRMETVHEAMAARNYLEAVGNTYGWLAGDDFPETGSANINIGHFA
jgi:hypothetical protein